MVPFGITNFPPFLIFILQIQRLASYERYFQDLLCETGADHPDLDDVHKARDKAQEVNISSSFSYGRDLGNWPRLCARRRMAISLFSFVVPNNFLSYLEKPKNKKQKIAPLFYT